MNPALRFRFWCAGVHSLVSLGVGVAVAALIFLVMHPAPFAPVSGSAQLFLILMGVDLSLGPLLTLTVAQQHKRRAVLARDLAVIGLLQLSALIYGVHVMAQARPVVLALEVDRLRLVSAADVLESEWDLHPAQVKSLPWNGPLWLGTRQAVTDKERELSVMMAMRGSDLGTRPGYWIELDENMRDILRKQACEPGILQAAGVSRPAAELSCPLLLARSGAWRLVLQGRDLKPLAVTREPT